MGVGVAMIDIGGVERQRNGRRERERERLIRGHDLAF